MLEDFSQVRAGWAAYDQSGERIGEVAELGRGYLLVQKGLFFPSDLYIPLSSVELVDPDDESLTIAGSKEEAESYGWTTPPADTDEGWDGTRGTAPVDSSAESIEEDDAIDEGTVGHEKRDVETGELLAGAGASHVARSAVDETSTSSGARIGDDTTDDPYRTS